MIYLLPGKSSLINSPSYFGCMTAPHGGGLPKAIREGRPFAVDNECFTRPFDVMRMAKHLKRPEPYKSNCLFVTVPDIAWLNNERVFDARITLEMFEEWANHPLFSPWPLAYVAQNGAEDLPLPDCQAVFIGGDTDWKLSDAAETVIKRAKGRGVWVHVGRVNSRKRLFHFDLMGVDSVDGTGLVYNPPRVMAQLTRWLAQPTLFSSVVD